MMKRNNNYDDLSFKEKSKIKLAEIKEELTNPVQKAVRARRFGSAMGNLLRGFIFFGLAFIIIFPIFEQITYAIRDPIDLTDPLVNYIPRHLSFTNLILSIALLDYWKSLWINIRMSTIVAVLQVLSTSLAGYAFARLKFKGSEVIFWLVMLTLIVPPQAVALSRSLYLSNFDIFGIIGLFNNGLGISLKGPGKEIVVYIMALTGQGIKTALFVYIFRQFFRGIPIELEESAQIDGAGVFKTFASVMLPNARGAIIVVALFSFVWQWNDTYFVDVYALNGPNFPVMTKRLSNVAEWVKNLLGDPRFADLVKGLVGPEIKDNTLLSSVIANTCALLMMLPLLIAYLFVQKLFIEGVERSGIVG